VTNPDELPAVRRADRARRSAAQAAQRLESTALGRLWSRLLELEFVDRLVALAAKAFVSFFPLLILVAAVTPSGVREEILETITNRLGVSGDALATVQQAFASADQTRAATELLGALITVAFAVSSRLRYSGCICGRGAAHPAVGYETRVAPRFGSAGSSPC
jgi:hypothetical protein